VSLAHAADPCLAEARRSVATPERSEAGLSSRVGRGGILIPPRLKVKCKGKVGMFLHIRFGPILLEWVQATLLPDLKPSQYVLCREYGSQLHGEHHHIALESPIGVEAIKKRFQAVCKSLGLVTLRGQENKYYGGVKEWVGIDYVCKEGVIVASSGYSPEELAAAEAAGKEKYRQETPVQVVVASSLPTSEVVTIIKKKSESMRAKFVRYLSEEQGWKYNVSISLECWDQRCKELVDHLTEFWENAFTTPQAVVCIEHARWVFGDDDVRDLLKRKRYASINNMLC